MKLATTTADFNRYTSDQAESIKLIHASGFRYVDYSFDYDFDSQTGAYSDELESYCERINKLATDLGVNLIQAHAPCISILDGENYKAIERCLVACELLGIPNVVVHSGYARGVGREEFMRVNREIYVRLAEFADKHNVTVLIENYDRMTIEDTFWPDSAEAVAELVDLVGHPRVAAIFDVGHANLKPMSIKDEIKLLGKRLKAIHVHDNNGRFDTHRAPFMGGSTGYDALISGLIDIGYEGYFTFEATNMADTNPSGHRKDEGDRLLRLPIAMRVDLERILYSIGKWMLSEYGIFEE